MRRSTIVYLVGVAFLVAGMYFALKYRNVWWLLILQGVGIGFIMGGDHLKRRDGDEPWPS